MVQVHPYSLSIRICDTRIRYNWPIIVPDEKNSNEMINCCNDVIMYVPMIK